MKKSFYLAAALSVLLWSLWAQADPIYEGWVSRYQGSGLDKANDLAVDAQGNVYVTGVINGNFGTAKLDKNTGNAIWVREYNGPGNGYDEATCIVLDGGSNAGYFYVTGKSWGANNNGFDYAIIAYTCNGNPTDTVRFNRAPGFTDVPTAIGLCISSEGEASVVGVTGNSWIDDMYDQPDIYTVQYQASHGELYFLWDAWYDGSPGAERYNFGDRYNYIDEDWAYDLVMDEHADVYVTGSSWDAYPATSRDIITIKYDGVSGQVEWEKRYSTGYGTDGVDAAFAVALDANRNAYVVGGLTLYYGQGTWCDWVVVKYDASGNQKWAKVYNGPANGRDCARDVAVDASGNVYVTGYTDVQSGPGVKYDFLTIKYNKTTGDTLWTRKYNGGGFGQGDRAAAIATDLQGNVYVTGWGHTGYSIAPVDNATGTDYTTLSYSPTGSPRWIMRYNGPGNGEDSIGVANVGSYDWDNKDRHGRIAIRGSDVHVTGSSDRLSGSAVNLDWATVKYQPNVPVAIHEVAAFDENTELLIHPPAIFALTSYPEPFNPTTAIRYSLPEAAQVTLRVYDLSGRQVATLEEGWRSAGHYEVRFDGSSLPSGMYFCRLEAGTYCNVVKMMLAK